MKVVQMTMPEPLLQRLDRCATERAETRSSFIRAAIERELRRIENAEYDRQFRESYERMPVTAAEERELRDWESIQAPLPDEDWSDWE